MVPWLGLEDQEFVLPEGRRYESKEEQEAYAREWLRGAGVTTEADDLRLVWYDARYHQVRACLCVQQKEQREKEGEKRKRGGGVRAKEKAGAVLDLAWFCRVRCQAKQQKRGRNRW